jgi:hypothetical protein
VSVFEPHWEALPPAQRELWGQLGASADLGFVLYGGTAIALRLGHRTSIDFDFFTERELDRKAIRNGFAFLREAKVVQDRPDSFGVLVATCANPVKVSFFGKIDIGRCGVPDRTSDGVAEVASLLDLLATKLKVLQQRIEAKDYRDVAAILRANVSLEDGLAAASALYGSSFQPSEAARALTFFQDGDLDELNTEDRRILVTAAARLRSIPFAAPVSRSLSGQGFLPDV